MSDVLTEFLAEGPVVKRPVTLGGKQGELHFRRLSLVELIKVQAARGDEEGGDGARELGVALHVQYSVCNADGSPRFPTVEAAQALGGVALMALYRVAVEVNAPGGEDLGKA